jgi:hypothetical protein
MSQLQASKYVGSSFFNYWIRGELCVYVCKFVKELTSKFTILLVLIQTNRDHLSPEKKKMTTKKPNPVNFNNILLGEEKELYKK